MESNSNDSIFEEQKFKLFFPEIISNLDSVKLKNSHVCYRGFPLREFLGLLIVTSFRKHIEFSKDWFFTTKKNVNDDGAVSYLGINRNDVDYPYDNLEQVYLPRFFKRKDNEFYEDFLIRFLKNKKLNRNCLYKFNKSLVLLNDVDTIQGFNYVKVLQEIFPKNKINFKHFYYIGYVGQNDEFALYSLLSYTDKPYRSYLNGQYKIFIYKNGECKFRKKQNLVDVWNTSVY